MRQDIKTFIIRLLEKKSSLTEEQSIDAYRYLDNGHIDSIALIKFIAEIENEFDIELSDDEIMSDDFRVVSGLIDLIENKLVVTKFD